MDEASDRDLGAQLPLAVFAVGTVFFTLQILSGVTWMDVGELSAAAQGLGVSHPPGHPGHALLGKLASFLPIGEVATRLSLLSAIGGGATLAGIVAMVRCSSKHDEGAAVVAALLLALTPALRINATRPEVYTACTALCSWSLVFALRFTRAKDSPAARDALASIFCVALAALFHPAIAMAVALGVAGVLCHRARRRSLRLAPVALGLVLLAGLGYLYLLVRANAATTPSLMWGDPSSLSSLIDHMTASVYGDNVGTGGLGSRLAERFALLGEGSGSALLFVGLAGLMVAFVTGLSGIGVLPIIALLVLVGGALQAAYNPDMRAYLLMTQVVLTVGVALAVAAGKRALPAFLIQSVRQKQLMGAALAVPVFGFAIAGGPSEASRLDDSDDAMQLWDETVSLMPPGPGLYLAGGDHSLFVAQYEELVAGSRPDIAIANTEMVRDLWFLEHIDRRLPELYLPFIDDGIKGQPAQRLVAGNLQAGHPVGGERATPLSQELPGVWPMGRGFRYALEAVAPSEAEPSSPLHAPGRLSSRIFGKAAYERARYHARRGQRRQAAIALGAWGSLSTDEQQAFSAAPTRPALEQHLPRTSRVFLHAPWISELLLDDLRYQSGIDPREPHPERPFEMRLHAAWRAALAEGNPRHPALIDLGQMALDITVPMLVAIGEVDLAEAELRRRVEANAPRADDLALLASLLGNKGADGLEESLALFIRATEAAPDNDESWARRGLAAAKLGKMDEARRSWTRALQLNPRRGDVAGWLRSLGPASP